MADEYVTQSMAKKDDSIDPYFQLIMSDDLAQNKWPQEIDENKKQEKQALMTQVMDKTLFDKLKDLKTKKAGWTIARAINTGVCYPSSFMGCHAGDSESYTMFKELFHPVIEKYHVGYKLDGTMKHVTDMDVEKIAIDLSDSAKEKVISTRIRCARNIAAFPLNPAASKENRIVIADLMEKVFADISNGDDESKKDLGGTFYRHTTMTPEETQQLVDDHFLFRGKDKMQAASGYHQYWPEGRGIFCSKDKTFLLWINEGDHIRIISMEKGGDVKRVFERLSRGVRAIEEGLQKITKEKDVFMSDPILGMVTCCPTNLGTGMRGSVHILVPKLIKSIGFEKIDELARTMNCQARGSTGEHSEVIDRIDVSNWRRLGFPEHELVQDMIKFANKLAEMEDECEQ